MTLFKVRHWMLYLLDGIIWTGAGINILRIGIGTWADGAFRWYFAALPAIAILAAFSAMFRSIVRKNIARIDSMEEDRIFFWRMMPPRSWVILAFMMSLGIFLRSSGLASDFFIAFFYCGLGTALLCSGINYIVKATHSITK